jgi:hypothetical protein
MGEAHAVPAMPYEQIALQPPAVWRCVEGELQAGWFGRARQLGVGTVGVPVPPGWLTLALVKQMDALGAPASNLFTACALRLRTKG